MSFSVIFDMDGVIVDNSYYHQLAWKQFCNIHSLSFSQKKFNTIFFGRTNKQVIPDLFGQQISSEKIIELSNQKENIYRKMYLPHIKPVKGLISLIEELKINSINTAVATSAQPENVEFILNTLNIRHYFNIIIDDSMISKGKPDPEIYLKTAKALNTEPSSCIVFEDSLSGTKAAMDSGAFVISLTTTLPRSKHKFTHHIIHDFSEISVNLIKSKILN